jgi:chemotaxis protein MotB
MKKLLIVGGAALVAGTGAGFVVRPAVAPDSRIGELETKVAEANKAATANKTRAEGLDKDLETMMAAKREAETKLNEAQQAQTQLASKAADAEAKVKASEQVRAKLQASVDKSIGMVSADGEEIHLQLVDKVMFKTMDDQLTDRGKQVLGRVAAALKELPDKQIWVQGHTDDQPIVQPPPPKPLAVKKGQKPPPPPAPTIKFATNWELSSARALTVVHYLQDTAKLDPTRLAALAFGQYHPISRSNKALNRRIEIVLYPKPVVKK